MPKICSRCRHGVGAVALTAYRVLFGICAGAAVLGAAIALIVPKSQAA